jgi:hypothetical protein
MTFWTTFTSGIEYMRAFSTVFCIFKQFSRSCNWYCSRYAANQKVQSANSPWLLARENHKVYQLSHVKQRNLGGLIGCFSSDTQLQTYLFHQSSVSTVLACDFFRINVCISMLFCTYWYIIMYVTYLCANNDFTKVNLTWSVSDEIKYIWFWSHGLTFALCCS